MKPVIIIAIAVGIGSLVAVIGGNYVVQDKGEIQNQVQIIQTESELQRDIKSSVMCESLMGHGSNINFVIVPCRFEESDKIIVHSIVNDIVEDFERTEPYKSNLDKFSIYLAEDYERTSKLDTDDKWTCTEDLKIIEVVKECVDENLVIISLGKGPTMATSRNGIAVVPISEQYKHSDSGWVALHESGHVLGLAEHSCHEPLGKLYSADLSHINQITGQSYIANCGVTQISENEPCEEWQTEEYSKWVLPNDPNFGCYEICGNNENYFRPWEDGNLGIMCQGAASKVGFTPVERKMLYDRLVDGPYPFDYKVANRP